MSSISPWLGAGRAGLTGWILLGATAAQAVNDLPGGPAVRQMSYAKPATQIAAQMDWLHSVMMVICVLICIAVFGVMFYSILKHRKSRGHKPADFHESVKVEIAWTVVPFLIVIGMGAMATKTVVAQKDTTNADITIKATGYQWKWGYDYLKGEGEGIRFVSTLATPRDQIENRADKGENYLLEVDNEVVVPVGKKVRVLTTAGDVIHSWWIPALAAKQDAIPGFIRDTWFRAEKIGTFRGQCVELCGKDHGFMPIVVKVVSAEDYSKWVGEKKKAAAAQQDDPNKQYTMDELKARGEKVYAANCVACHQATGKGMPPAFPALDGSKLVAGPKADQIALVLGGKPGTAMAAFGKQLNDVELAAVITFTRNNWGNKTGEAIQPAEVKSLRK